MGRSRTHTGRRPCTLAGVLHPHAPRRGPHGRHHLLELAVTLAHRKQHQPVEPDKHRSCTTVIHHLGPHRLVPTPRILRLQARSQTHDSNRVAPGSLRVKSKSHTFCAHQAYWDVARAANGDAWGTRWLIDVLLAYRTHPTTARIAAMERAVI